MNQKGLILLVLCLFAVPTNSTARLLNESAKLVSSDLEAGDGLGWAVGLDGDTAVVGGTGVDCPSAGNCGAVYVFVKDNNDVWREKQKILNPSPSVGEQFGYSLSIKGNMLLAGVPREECGLPQRCGAVYLFERDSSGIWQQRQKIIASDRQNGDRFGESISFDQNSIVIGAPGDNCVAGTRCGAAYIFEENDVNQWQEMQKISADVEGDFGTSVSVDGNSLIVGAFATSCTNGTRCGTAYTYNRDNSGNWYLNQEIAPPDLEEDDFYGKSVAVGKSTAFIGAPLRNCDGVSIPTNAGNCGAVYEFIQDESGYWTQGQTLKAFGTAGIAFGNSNSSFGSKVKLQGDVMAASAPAADCGPNSGSCGAVLLFSRNKNGRWNPLAVLTASDGDRNDALGQSIDLDGNSVIGGGGGAAYVFDKKKK